AIRDDYVDPFTGISEDEWAYKGSAILDLGQSGWQVGGWYAKDSGHTQYVTGYFSREIDEEWGVQVNGAVAANLSVYAMYSEASGLQNSPLLGAPFDVELTQLAVGAVWAPVSGLTVQLEYANTETDFRGNFGGTVGFHTNETESVSVRVTRSF
ncbi:MAG: hypothetical protein WBD01_04200, partial [Salaquimonas sp.]